MFDQFAEYLNNIEEMTCEMSYRELIDTPIWPEDARTTQGANINKESESPGPKDVRPITIAATLYCAWSSTRHREAMAWAKHAWLHKMFMENSRSQGAERNLASPVENGGHDEG